MTTATDQVPAGLVEQVLGLPRVAREQLADLLRESVAGPAPLSPEWKEEIARRLKADDAGQMRYYTLDEVDAHLAAVDAESRGP